MTPQHRDPDMAHLEGGKPFTALALQVFSALAYVIYTSIRTQPFQ